MYILVIEGRDATRRDGRVTRAYRGIVIRYSLLVTAYV